MPDNLVAGNFEIVSLTAGNPLAGAINDPDRDFQCIRLNLPLADTTVCQFLVSIPNARLISSAVVGSSRRGRWLSAQGSRLCVHWKGRAKLCRAGRSRTGP
jgi:hypothetical protein